MQITQNCIINNMPAQVYHNDPTPEVEGFKESTSMSSSTLRELLEKTEIEARDTINRFNPNKNRESTKEMDLGSIAHEYVLRGKLDLFEIVPYDNFRTKDAQTMRDDIVARGKIALNNTTKYLIDDVKEMKSRLFEQIAEHKDWKGIFDTGAPEQAVFAFDGEVWLRALIDWHVKNYINPDGLEIKNLIVDYKTTGKDFSDWEKNDLWKEKYIQDPHYRKTLDLVTGDDEGSRFIFVVQQKKAPYLMQIFEIDKSRHDLIEERYKHARSKFINCLKTGKWRGVMPYTAYSIPPTWIEQKWEMDILNEEFMADREKREAEKANKSDDGEEPNYLMAG